jgi:lipopolysaccharide export system protein LptC
MPANSRTPLSRHLQIVTLLLILTVVSTWALYRLNLATAVLDMTAAHAPDYYLKDFTTTAMDRNGDPDYKLDAVYLAHYPDIDTTEVLIPSMEFYRDGRPPLRVTADKGWLTADNEVVLLSGDVVFTETDADGNLVLRVNTDKARVLVDQHYAETDHYASIRTRRANITGTGMQADFKAGTLKVLNDVRTIITPH